ncbi:MAG: hypothetical protein O7B99_04825 [Planctomycetota bacterium]|nr:hypothetical protein [Planctomycetota bacterium]
MVVPLTAPGRRMGCADDVPRDVARRWLEEYPRWVGAERIARVESPMGPVVVKREPLSAYRRLLAALRLRPTRSEHAFRLGRKMLAAGVATPRPLAWIALRERGAPVEDGLVLEQVEAPTLSHVLLERSLAKDPNDREKQLLLGALAAAIARLHGAGFRHRDLKAPNVLVAEEDQGPPKIVLVDLEGAGETGGPPSERVRARDLARLAVSLSTPIARAAGIEERDWGFLVAAYLRLAFDRPPDVADVARLVAETRAWARRHATRNERRGRPIA